MLKILILGILSCKAFAFTEEQIQLMNSLHSECISQTGVEEELIENARAGDFKHDPKLKCYMKCIFDEVGVIGDDGQIDIEGAMAIMPEEIKDFTTPVLKSCGTQAGTDICDSIFNTLKCYYDTDKRAFFLP